MNKRETLKTKFPSLKDNARRVNLNINSFAKLYKTLRTKTRTWEENLKILNQV
jgi:hypothetical protein